MLNEYINALTTGLLNLNIGISPSLAGIAAKTAIYTVAIYTLLSIVILLGRLTGQVRIVNSIGTKALVSGCTLFMLYAAISLFMIRGEFVPLLVLFRPQTLLHLLKNLDQLAMVAVMLAVLAFVLFILFGMLYFCGNMFIALFSDNISVNGIFKGLFLSFYELFSGAVWLSLILCGFSLGIAIIILPILLLLASLKSDRYTTYYY